MICNAVFYRYSVIRILLTCCHKPLTLHNRSDRHISNFPDVSPNAGNITAAVSSWHKMLPDPQPLWRRQKFSLGGAVAQGSEWGPGAVSAWLRRRPPKTEAVCRHCLQILTTEMIKIWKFPHTSIPNFWPVGFTVRGLTPSPCVTPPLPWAPPDKHTTHQTTKLFRVYLLLVETRYDTCRWRGSSL